MKIAGKPQNTTVYVRADTDGTYIMQAVSGKHSVQCSRGWRSLDAAYAAGSRAILDAHASDPAETAHTLE